MSTKCSQISSTKAGFVIRLYLPCGGTAVAFGPFATLQKLEAARQLLLSGGTDDEEIILKTATWFEAWTPEGQARSAKRLADLESQYQAQKGRTTALD